MISIKKTLEALANMCKIVDVTTSYPLTKTSGNSNIVEYSALKIGHILIINAGFRTTSSTSSGSDVFEGKINGLRPYLAIPIIASGVGYSGATSVITQIQNDGTLISRVTSASLPASYEFSATLITIIE